MKFTISHARALSGNDISVKVEADGGKAIQSVLTRLDGFELANDELANPSDVYERSFAGAGTAGIGNAHTLIVSATLEDESTHSSTSIWSDPTKRANHGDNPATLKPGPPAPRMQRS